MLTALIIYIVIYIAAMWYLTATAPIGYEDNTGFHEIKKGDNK